MSREPQTRNILPRHNDFLDPSTPPPEPTHQGFSTAYAEPVAEPGAPAVPASDAGKQLGSSSVPLACGPAQFTI